MSLLLLTIITILGAISFEGNRQIGRTHEAYIPYILIKNKAFGNFTLISGNLSGLYLTVFTIWCFLNLEWDHIFIGFGIYLFSIVLIINSFMMRMLSMVISGISSILVLLLIIYIFFN